MAIPLETLLEEAQCLCAAGGSTAERTMMALLQRIAEAGGGGGTPGGLNTQVQYNDGGVFGGSAGMTFNDATNRLSVTGVIATGVAVTIGTAANIETIGGGDGLRFVTGFTSRWDMVSTGHILAFADNAYDIGASGATRPRNLFLAGGITTGATILHTTSATLTDNAGGGAGTIGNAPSAGDPTKWIAINDNGTPRYIPTWT